VLSSESPAALGSSLDRVLGCKNPCLFSSMLILVLNLWSAAASGLSRESRRSPVWLRSCTLHIEMQGLIESGDTVQ
jgi:hypothetical protein